MLTTSGYALVARRVPKQLHQLPPTLVARRVPKQLHRLPPLVFAYCGHTRALYLTTTTTRECGYCLRLSAIHLVTTRSSVYTEVAYQVATVFKH